MFNCANREISSLALIETFACYLRWGLFCTTVLCSAFGVRRSQSETCESNFLGLYMSQPAHTQPPLYPHTRLCFPFAVTAVLYAPQPLRIETNPAYPRYSASVRKISA